MRTLSDRIQISIMDSLQMLVKGCFSSIAKLLKDRVATRTVVLTGAGISVPSGIPDFRTPGSGLYDSLAGYNLPYPEAIFDIAYFRMNPKPFFKLAKSLYPGVYPPSAAHWFIRLLQDKERLLRVYTQNIDGLETLAGISRDQLVEAHGSFAEATCVGCLEKYVAQDIREQIFNGQVPICKKCQNVVKPNVVFFGEILPHRFYTLQLLDLPRADLLIVMGTSLEVYPFASLASIPGKSVPKVLINRDTVGPFANDPGENDVIYEGDIVSGVEELAHVCGWSKELKALADDYKTASPG